MADYTCSHWISERNIGSTALPLGCRCAIAAGLTLALTGLARADQTHDCDAYAAQAVAQQQENLTLGCGIGGDAWSTDAQGHRAWCRLPTVGMAAAGPRTWPATAPGA